MNDGKSLFNSADLQPQVRVTGTWQAPRLPGAQTSELADPDLDTAKMWISDADGRLMRGVKPHSAKKATVVSRSLDTVSVAMSNQWFAKRFGVQYAELYCGPGVLFDERRGEPLNGSPPQALAVRKPFTRYVFSDFSQDCTDALAHRIGQRPGVHVVTGDANDLAHLELVCSYLDERALVIFYLDPARPRDLRWPTVKYLADRFEYVDLLINLPVNSLVRGISGAVRAGAQGPGACGLLLNHPKPGQLLGSTMRGSIQAIREHYDQQLVELGFLRPLRSTIEFPPGNPYYDILMVSRHPTALDLWRRTNPPPPDPQLSFDDELGVWATA